MIPGIQATTPTLEQAWDQYQFRLVQDLLCRFQHDRPVPGLPPGLPVTDGETEPTAIEISRMRRGRIAERRAQCDRGGTGALADPGR
jgi:hypothetical protein